ncbi:BPSS1780 family membrane protein [Massilia sp. erpn]|uniref:BPSS1780 family membrane protein n=1 Tax=Massilia sp. erpn TaxID=2738142 RepID=UPI002106E874|nr:BPSS1780 family membrane protein [Massilia sp. erpn]UTY56382.1 hypothetical protein HPQ68_03740 [Massilia sp. erpn]
MTKLPALTGWHWVKDGFALFRQQPGGMFIPFLGYLLCQVAVLILPQPLGLLVALLLPAVSIGFMQACADIEQGKRVLPAVIQSGFRKPAFPKLVVLGVLHLVAILIAVIVVFATNGELVDQLRNADPAAPQIQMSNGMAASILLGFVVYIPAAMGLFFSGPLIYWKQMSVGKAVFFSFFAVLRAWRPCIVFLLSWAGIAMVVSLVRIALLGMGTLGALLMQIPVMIVALVLQCSLYVSYRQIFGSPAAPAEETRLPV